MSIIQSLPRWDMTPVFPSLESPEFAKGFAEVVSDIDELATLFDTHRVQEQPVTAFDEALIPAFETLIDRYNQVLRKTHILSTYILCFVRTNSYDNLAQARMSELQRSQVRLSLLNKRFTAWLGGLDMESLIAHSSVAREHAYYLRRAQAEAAHLMSPSEEVLAGELNPSGGSAWARLHGNVTSQLTVEMQQDGQRQELPMSVVRNMAYDTDREVRREAYEAELAGWKRVAIPLAAALNSIKGEVNVLAQHRKWEAPLDIALFVDSIDREILDVMLAAARESFPDFRRYLHAKARALGLSRLAWYDLFAPVGTQ
ncbi:MAG: oligoendopeptidase F, partial [Ktedonobacteraceae bacterium]|nr:oligoendopeptidase F [Ktedonobacteraceae bacterium]